MRFFVAGLLFVTAALALNATWLLFLLAGCRC